MHSKLPSFFPPSIRHCDSAGFSRSSFAETARTSRSRSRGRNYLRPTSDTDAPTSRHLRAQIRPSCSDRRERTGAVKICARLKVTFARVIAHTCVYRVAYIHTYICTCMHACIRTYVRTCVHTRDVTQLNITLTYIPSRSFRDD